MPGVQNVHTNFRALFATVSK